MGKYSRTERRNAVERCLTAISDYAKELCPDADVEIIRRQYEDEDGHVRMFAPESLDEDAREELGDKLVQRALEIQEDTGIVILTAVLEPWQKTCR
jgi:hypothetical protein